MAAVFTNQPRTTPIYNQQQATQLGSGNFTSMQPGTQPGMQGFGGQPGGMNGNIYPLGQQFGHTTIYAVVESGQPIILDPKTGKPYPPGYIPTIQDPNTWEQWTPGQSWAETMELANAELAEGKRQAIETLVRPGEEAAAEATQGFMRDLNNAANKLAGQTAQNLYGKDNKTLKNLQEQASQTGRQVINQAPQVVRQGAQNLTQQAGKMFSGVTSSGSVSPRPAASAFGGGGMTSASTSVVGDRAAFSGTRRY
ncbi:hypothetical protein [Microcoleus sp. D2_18a_D3]|uniref:hypothetical protein n=1 Tax=Microcoleus sp. D2_18a_D3 TaxID=3055330 RepID=UPI002FD20649